MHLRDDGTLLKTKIVATIGPERGGVRRGVRDEIFDPSGNPVEREIDAGTILEWLIRDGADVIRLNMSFASAEESYGATETAVLQWLTAHRNDVAKHVAVLGDLPGPKIRLNLSDRQLLRKGDAFILDFRARNRLRKDHPGADVLVYDLPFEDELIGARVNREPGIGGYVRGFPEASFYVGDGDVVLKPVEERDGIVHCEVLRGGEIRPRALPSKGRG